MGEFDPSRTYAIPKLKWALCDPHGAPISLHASPSAALGAWVLARKEIILDESSRQRLFRALLKARYSIRPANAWCRVQPHPLEKLAKEKSIVKAKAKAGRSRK
jgi:hypothetical protein